MPEIQTNNLVDHGQLKIQVTSGQRAVPIPNATIEISYTGDPDSVLETVSTDENGQTPVVDLPAPPVEYSMSPSENQPYSEYNLKIHSDEYKPVTISGAQILSGVEGLQPVSMIPEETHTPTEEHPIVIGPHTLWGNYPPKIAESEIKPVNESGEIVLSRVVIPEYIIVHDGPVGDKTAQNYYVRYKDYIKNVASSEIYPTWPEAALRANIYAIITFALNRIYTEWYRSRGYPFDITDSTQYDQKYTYGREVFENINRLVDEQLNTYIRRQGTIEPLFAAFCNGTTVTCEGLSQWGTVGLAEQGYSPYDILTYYYGDTIDLVQNVPVQTSTQSYPGFPLELGYSGKDVRMLQIQLNRISRNYPAIPKIGEITGSFGYLTQEAVLKFQEIFNLSPTGMVDEATWYRIAYIYTSVKRLAELDSEGIAQGEFPLQYEEELHIGMQGQNIRALQYYLAMVGAYYANVEPVPITGYFGEQTETSVKSFQRTYGLPETGVVDRATWYDLYRAYMGILDSMPPLAEETEEIVPFPGIVLQEGVTSPYVRILQEYLNYVGQTYPEIGSVRVTGYFGPMTRSAITTFQRLFGLVETGTANVATWNDLTSVYSDLKYGYQKQPYQNPGYIIT